MYTRPETADLKEGKRQNMRSIGTWDGTVTANHKPMATPILSFPTQRLENSSGLGGRCAGSYRAAKMQRNKVRVDTGRS